MREYQLYLLNERKLTAQSVAGRITALRFFFSEGSAPTVSGTGFGLSKTSRTLAKRSERRRSDKADRIGLHFISPVILTALYATGIR
jgi:hypothetical protein